MGRSACCDENGLKKGPWTEEEDEKLVKYMERYGGGGGGRGGISWRQVPKLAGLKRCGKSCRLRWTNYLRPDIKRGNLSHQEEQTIINLHALVGNKWSAIASNLPGRTDNEIKNFWNTHLKKKLLQMGIDPVTHNPITTPHNHHISTTATSTLPPQLLAATYNNLMNNNTTPWDWAHLQYLNSVHATQVVAEILRGQGLVISNSTTTTTPTTPNSYDHYPYILGMEMEAAVTNYYNYLLGSSPSSSTSVPDHQLVYHHGHGHGLGYDYADLTMINRHSNCPQATSLGNTTTTSHYDHHDEYSSKFAIANTKAPSSTEDDHKLQNELYHDQQGGNHHHHQLPVLVSAATSPYVVTSTHRTANDLVLVSAATSPYVVTSTHRTANDLIAGMDDDNQEATNDQSYWKRHIMDIDIASSQIWSI